MTVPHSFNYCSFRSVQRSFSFIAKSLFFTSLHSCLNHSLKFLLNLIGFDLILLCLSLHFPKLYFTALYYCDFLAPYRLFYSSAHCQIMLVLLRANDHNVIMLQVPLYLAPWHNKRPKYKFMVLVTIRKII